ncbi:hypothetical protein CTA2_2090 [Colletotrichum tanaceti]|nr:hypothetical protein CTA2_2090 [Colletotrichum tanaceti]
MANMIFLHENRTCTGTASNGVGDHTQTLGISRCGNPECPRRRGACPVPVCVCSSRAATSRAAPRPPSAPTPRPATRSPPSSTTATSPTRGSRAATAPSRRTRRPSAPPSRPPRPWATTSTGSPSSSSTST